MLQHEESCNEEQVIRLQPPTDENTEERLNQIDELKYFLGTATNDWEANRQVHSFPLPTGESLSCVFWNNLFHVTGTDIVRTLLYRFHLFGRPVTNLKKFEEGIFSDLRNLKPGMDASLEEPKSEFLEMLYKNNCIRTQKKQKVFFWFSVPHDRLFLDALERDLKREKINLDPTSVAIAEPATSLSLDTTQELFDQLRKSMSLSAVAAAHAMDDIPHSNIITSTNSTNTTTTTEVDHQASSYSHDNDDWASTWNQQKSDTTERTGHRPTRSLSSITLPPNLVSNHPQEYEQTSFSAGTSPKSDHFDLYPAFDKDESEKQKIFGAFSLFEGSPTYKQRQRRRTLSFNTSGYLDEDYQGSRLELAAINAGLAIINPHNLFQQSNHHHHHDHTGAEKVYTCPLPQCARIFKRLEHLKRHFRTHTLERPYSCNMCGKHFSRTDNLAQHKKTHNRPRSISVLTRCNSSSKLITLSNKSSDTTSPTTTTTTTTTRKRASSLRNSNCNEV
ncbi:STE like transcription factor-domain-containing protein, partial [Helicostylum pulchrum]